MITCVLCEPRPPTIPFLSLPSFVTAIHPSSKLSLSSTHSLSLPLRRIPNKILSQASMSKSIRLLFIDGPTVYERCIVVYHKATRHSIILVVALEKPDDENEGWISVDE